MVDVEHQDRDLFRGNAEPLDDAPEIGGEITPIVHPCQAVRHRGIDALPVIGAQPFLVSLAANLGLGPRDQLVLVDGTDEIIVDAELHRLGQPRLVTVLDRQQDGAMSGFPSRAQLRTQAQCAVIIDVVNQNEVEIPFGGEPHRVGEILHHGETMAEILQCRGDQPAIQGLPRDQQDVAGCAVIEPDEPVFHRPEFERGGLPRAQLVDRVLEAHQGADT